MAPPKRKGEDTGGENSLEARQAVVIADSLEVSFRPITCEVAKCLLPFMGLPILSYTLDFLRQNKVTEILFVVKNNGDEIQQFVKSCPISKKMQAEFLFLSSDVTSFGDVLREIDDRATALRDSFLLLYADSILSCDLSKAFEEHTARTSTDPNSVITKIFIPASPTSRLRDSKDDAVVIYDFVSKELIAWESLETKSSVDMDTTMIQRNGAMSSVKIRYDLLDPNIAICSSRILKMFSESFDYLTLREDFARDVLTKSIKTESMHVHILEASGSDVMRNFGARLKDPRTYFSVLLSICELWSHPLLADSSLFRDHLHLNNSDRGVFKGKNVKVSEDEVDIGPSVVLQADSTVGKQTRIRHSSIGKRCTIGDNVNLDRCIIFDDVTIGNGARCLQSIFYNGVVIGEGATISPGCVFGSEVHISENHIVPQNTYLTLWEKKEKEEEEEAEEEEGRSDVGEQSPYLYNPQEFHRATEDTLKAKCNEELTGKGGRGMLFKGTAAVQNGSITANNLMNILLEVPKMDNSDESASRSCCSDDENNPKETANKSPAESRMECRDAAFQSEVQSYFVEGLKEPSVMNNKILEVKSFRLASNKSDADVVRALVDPIFGLLSTKLSSRDFEIWIEEFHRVGADKIFQAFFDDDSEEHHFILYDTLLEFCTRFWNTSTSTICDDDSLSFLLQLLARLEIVDDEMTSAWHKLILEDSSVGDNMDAVHSLLHSSNLLEYIQWLSE